MSLIHLIVQVGISQKSEPPPTNGSLYSRHGLDKLLMVLTNFLLPPGYRKIK